MAVKGKGKKVAGKAPASSSSSSGKRKSTRADGESSGAPPKKKPSGVSRFVDDVAADTDFEPEEEEDDLEWEIDEDFDFELPDIGAKEVKNMTRGPGKSSPLPFFIKEEEMDDDELEEAIKERYRSSGFVSFDEDVKEFDESLFVTHATKDLSVWRVKCMMGRERQAAFCLMQKFVDLLKIGKKLQIFSVFALDHVKGFFYVESEKACNVFEACNGLCILYSSRIELVPRNEAPNLLSIQKKTCGISKGMWVRMKNGKYKGDIAEAVFVNDAKKRVTIKLVPRIDLQAIAKKFGGGTSLKAAVIPAPRLISCHELEDFRPHIEVRRDRETGEIFEVLDGLMLKDGYLYKKVSMCSLIHWGVEPSSDELTKFEDLGKDEAKDVSWLSSIYKVRIKKKLPETSHQKNGEKSNQKGGEKSNQKDGDKQRNGYDIDDLVLFGKKGCGIIIDMENDTFKVLKGDVNGSEVVSIDVRVIKKNCVDKVFTATDRSMKTISIDDVVKVSEGPLEGREGIVRHMYKGVLFLYDECQSENNGFFCAKSEICDLVKKSRVFGGGKLSSNAGPSFAQSPIRSSEQDDNSQSFSRNRQNNSRGTFSVGQTLRICKGPLKGYLCRVIRIYRADITVKLDSLGKLLTVDEKLLSFSNSKRDDATAMQCDMFESKEEQSTGLGMDNFEFNAGMSSFGRDSWNTPSCSSFSFPRENDNKDQKQGADPWGSKPSSSNGDQEQGAANSWGKAPSSGAEQSSWNKMESGEKGADADCKNDADAWNKASTKGGTSTGGWQNDSPVEKTSQTCSTKGTSSGWDSAVPTAVDGASDAGGWSKAKFSTPDSIEGQTLDQQQGAANSWGKAWSSGAEPSSWNKMNSGEKSADADCKNDADVWNKTSTKGDSSTGGWQNDTPVQKTNQTWSTKGEDGWNRAASKPHNENNAETSGWEQIKPPSSDAGGSWNATGATVGCNKETSGKDRADGFGGNPGNWASSKSDGGDGDNLDSWGIKGKGLIVNNDDSWGKSAASQEIKSVDNNPWQSSLNSSAQGKAWKTPSADDNQAAEDGRQSNSWSKVKSPPSSSGWEKSKATVTETVGGWKTTTDDNQASGWGASATPLATPSVDKESQPSGWDKSSTSPRSSGWQIGKQPGSTANEGWKKDGFSSEGQIGGWNKEKSSDRDQASGWNKVGNAGGGKDASTDTDSWDKAKSSEGRGFGQESRGQWKAGDDWRNDSDSGQGSGWSQGNSSNENGKSWGRGNSWNQQRDFDGGRGFSRGRGRGRYGGRGGRNEDSFEKPGDSDGGWRFGRGRGRGQSGAGGYNRDNSDTREFGRGRGRDRGRGQDQGQFQTSDWRNGQERFDGGFSNKPSSSWGSTEGSDWGKSKDQLSTGVMEEKVGWNNGNSFDGVSKPGWGTDPQDAGGSKGAMNEDHASSWSKGVSTGKQIDNWSKETRNNDNWNTPKTFENKLSSLNQTSNDAAKDTTSSQSLKKNEIESTKVLNSPEASFADWCQTATLNKENEAQGGWSSKKVDTQASQPSSENENNWGKWKEPCSGSTAGNLGSSKGWCDNNNSMNWDSKKEPASSHGTWGGKDSSAGNQSSDWNNGGAKKWSEQSGGQGKSESWSHQSDSGRGGGRGRDNSFSRGRGRGRSSGGRHSYSWNSSDESGREGNDGGPAFNSNQEFKTGGSRSWEHKSFEGGKGSWNGGGNAEKGSWGSRKSEGENQPADRGGWNGGNAEKGSWGSWKSGENQAKQDSGWAPSASLAIDKVEGSSADESKDLLSSKGLSDNNNSVANWDSPSSAWDTKKEPISSQGNWGGKDSSASQSSDWNNGGGNRWRSQDKSESWSRGSDFGGGRGRGRDSDFGRGRGGGWDSDFGRGRGRGRDNSFSTRGRGAGRNSVGGGYGKDGVDGWQSFNSNQEFKTGGSWSSEGSAQKGSWGGWKSEGENQPVGQAEPQSQAESSKGSWASSSAKELVTTGKSSWDSPTVFGGNKLSGWEPDSSKDLVADGTNSSEQKSDPWGSANTTKMGQESTWNSASSDEKQNHHLSETDPGGSSHKNNAPSADGISKSWNEKGSGWSSETSRNDSVGEGKDWSNSNDGGRNSGW